MQYGIISSSDIHGVGLSFWQTPTWQEILKTSGQAQDVFYYGNIDSTFLLIEIRSIGLGFIGAFALGVNSTQVGGDWDNFRKSLQNFLDAQGVLFLQIEPLDEGLINESESEFQIPYKKFLTPFTRCIDLQISEEEILSQMHEKGRYNIRSAIKKGVNVEYAGPTIQNIDIWMNLLNDTLNRDHFAGNSREYYRIFLEHIVNKSLGGLYFATFEGRVIAAGIFVFMPDSAIYYYGASSSDESDRKAFAPYLLQWEMMKLAKQKGISTYDLLGISDPDSHNDSLAGVSFFKSRFGGKIIKLPQKMLYPISWKYRLFQRIQFLKNLLKRR